MNDTCEKILSEMIKVRKIAVWTSVFSLIALIVVMAYGYYAINKTLKKAQSSKATTTWSSVKSAYTLMEYDKGFELAKKLTEKAPDYYYGYKMMGLFCAAKGDLKSAEKYFAKACNLWPDEEQKEHLEVIRKAIDNKNRQNQHMDFTVKTPID